MSLNTFKKKALLLDVTSTVAVDQKKYAAVVSWLPEEANYWASVQNFKV